MERVFREVFVNVKISVGLCPNHDTVRDLILKNRKTVSPPAVEQTVACAPVTQRARVRSPVGICFLMKFFSGFFLTCKSNVRKL